MAKEPEKGPVKEPFFFRFADMPFLNISLSHNFVGKTFPVFVGNSGADCAQLEINMMKCAAATGQRKFFQRCQNELNDFNECQKGTVQYKRYLAMREERKRQGRPYLPIETDYIYVQGRI